MGKKNSKTTAWSGTWQMNYPVATVATLDCDQAARLLHGVRGGDPWQSWSSLEPRPLYVNIDYPLDKPVTIVVQPQERCMNLGLFLLDVAKMYQEIYKSPKRYGIFGHGIDDLAFESVTVRKSGAVILGIGS